VTTEALIFLGDLDPEAVGPSIEHATHYEATPPAEIDRLLDAVPLQPERCTLIDLGCGMGRVVLHAARRRFRQIIGVEISPALLEIARANRRAYRGPLACRDLRLVRADAARFTFPRGDLVVFLYNPFGEAILGPILDRLAAGPEREVAIAYHTPVARTLLDEHPSFALVAEVAPGLVYQRRKELEAQRRMQRR
jgi:SAM-dependent methyltransferase